MMRLGAMKYFLEAPNKGILSSDRVPKDVDSIRGHSRAVTRGDDERWKSSKRGEELNNDCRGSVLSQRDRFFIRCSKRSNVFR